MLRGHVFYTRSVDRAGHYGKGGFRGNPSLSLRVCEQAKLTNILEDLDLSL